MASSVADNGPASYRVTEGVCFVKPAEQPDGDRIIQVKRPVGSVVQTTGRTWTGPQGGLWAEVDVEREARMKMGWVNVKGLTRRPLLVDAAEEGAAQVVEVKYTKSTPIFSCMMQSDETIADFINIFCARTGLTASHVILTKSKPGKAPNGSGKLLPPDYTKKDDILLRDRTIKDAGITEPLNLIYTGDFDESSKILSVLQDGAKGGA